MNEVRARFLKAILDQLPAERIAEIHFFPEIRQGQIETGVAVLAVVPEAPLPVAAEIDESVAEEVIAETIDDVDSSPDAAPDDIATEPVAPPTERFEVWSAAYRWTRKGPERGKWEVDLTAEADAPLPTVGIVVRGVHERAGEAMETERITNAELQALLSEPEWQTTP
jgi:hypothetical protein